jgi:hypothetical protein
MAVDHPTGNLEGELLGYPRVEAFARPFLAVHPVHEVQARRSSSGIASSLVAFGRRRVCSLVFCFSKRNRGLK